MNTATSPTPDMNVISEVVDNISSLKTFQNHCGCSNNEMEAYVTSCGYRINVIVDETIFNAKYRSTFDSACAGTDVVYSICPVYNN